MLSQIAPLAVPFVLVLALPPAIPTFFPFKDSDFFLLLKFSCCAHICYMGTI